MSLSALLLDEYKDPNKKLIADTDDRTSLIKIKIMNQDRMPTRIRYVAAALHLSFVVSKLPILLIFSPKFEIVLLDFALIFTRPIIAWVFWLATSKIHHFIDRAGRDVVNYTLSNLVLSLWLLFPLFILGFGLLRAAFSSMSSYTNNVFFAICFGIGCILFCIEIIYLIHAIFASIFAIRGHRFQSRFVHCFIKSE